MPPRPSVSELLRRDGRLPDVPHAKDRDASSNREAISASGALNHRFELFGRIHAQVNLGGADVGMPEPQRHLSDVMRGRSCGRPSRDDLPCRSIDNHAFRGTSWLGRLNVCFTEFDVAAAWNVRGKRNTDSRRDAATDAEMRPRL
jgi:hypothetical protein